MTNNNSLAVSSEQETVSRGQGKVSRGQRTVSGEQ